MGFTLKHSQTTRWRRKREINCSNISAINTTPLLTNFITFLKLLPCTTLSRWPPSSALYSTRPEQKRSKSSQSAREGKERSTGATFTASTFWTQWTSPRWRSPPPSTRCAKRAWSRSSSRETRISSRTRWRAVTTLPTTAWWRWWTTPERLPLVSSTPTPRILTKLSFWAGKWGTGAKLKVYFFDFSCSAFSFAFWLFHCFSRF